MQAIPQPGLAILPQYLSADTQMIILKGSTFSKSMTASIANGQPLFHIEGENFSRSHRKTVIDASSNAMLYQVRKEGMGTKHYYAEMSENGPRLFETETHRKLMHRPKTIVTFANQADSSRPVIALEFTPAGMTSDGSFTLNGQLVAKVEKFSLSLSGEYQLTIAPGLDPSLIVGVMVAMIDRAKTQSNNSAAGGAAVATC